MSETLYRKYRPQKFDEVVGQDDIVSTLKNAIKEDKIAHSYIFAGSRGIGKTSIARILASALDISQNDLYEIDAASNRGIDDIRAIREAVHTLPYESKYKMYIIDEAHMLTRDAWNALLKTLEEPPAHVIFVLATTEVEKIPETIVSRSQAFSFKKPSLSTLESVIKKTAKKEGVEIDGDAISLLALLADGSFRDAHGLLQKAISSGNGKTVSLEDIERVTGAPKRVRVLELVKYIIAGDAVGVVKNIGSFNADNADPKLLSRLILENLRHILLLRIDSKCAEIIKKESGEEAYVELEKLSKEGKDTLNSGSLLELLKAFSDLDRSSEPFVQLELGLLSLVVSR
ncbi:MAG TPA: DNA polymerase III subunit gamma/tau [Candidatus Paceibacterota bacterium]|nr:DNA polymerase III subunit gamma/tau [Candidatus Paceibacterota bacterium]